MDVSPTDFYERIPTFDRFQEVGDTARYVPVPAGWVIGVADVEDSTGAIALGQYKAVNMVGAAVIAGVMNVLGTRAFPFVFGGDGAAIAVPPEAGAAAGDAMVRVRRFAEDSLGLRLRVGMTAVEAIRAAGHDVRIARLRVSKDITFALFSGGGVHWAEGELKANRLGMPDSEPGAWPNLEGLSCRWAPIKARNGRILSVIATPAPGVEDAEFGRLVAQISSVLEAAPDRGVPVSPETMTFPLPGAGVRYEAMTRRGRLDAAIAWLSIAAVQVAGWVIFRRGRPVGSFDPERYKRVSVVNSDFRKYDDGLRMTVDADAGVEARIRGILEEAHRAGTAFYGIHAQDAALMTCLVPSSLMTDDHLHFIDGASGGYARAAAMLKQQAAGAGAA